MITEVRYHNFKCLRDVRLALRPFTVVAGPNSCGKTSALEGIHRAFRLRRQLERELGKKGRPERIATRGSTEFAVECFLEGALLIGFRYVRSDGRNWHVDQLSSNAESHVDPFAEIVHKVVERDAERQREMWREEMSSLSSLLRFDRSALAASSFDTPIPRLKDTGRGLPSVLATIAATDPERFRELIEAAKGVIPTLKDVRLRPVVTDRADYEPVKIAGQGAYQRVLSERRGFEIRFDMHSGADLPADSVSEGTLFTIGLLAVAMAPEAPKIILLDNLERGLHPRAIGELVSSVRKLITPRHVLQIVATTHSPYVLDHFASDEIQLMCSDKNGFAVCGSLTDHPQFKRWKDEMLPGEFWSMVGEDWLQQRTVAVK